jgi:hypothetical protein
MPAWLMPVLKTILPHIGTIVSAAAPVFTRKSADAAANQAALLQQQITELQAAASENDAHIKELAIQMQHAVEAVEQGTLLADKRHQQMLALCAVSLFVALTSLGTSLYILLAR